MGELAVLLESVEIVEKPSVDSPVRTNDEQLGGKPNRPDALLLPTDQATVLSTANEIIDECREWDDDDDGLALHQCRE